MEAAPVPTPVAHAAASSENESLAALTTSRLNWCHCSCVIRSWDRCWWYGKPEDRDSVSVVMENGGNERGL